VSLSQEPNRPNVPMSMGGGEVCQFSLLVVGVSLGSWVGGDVSRLVRSASTPGDGQIQPVAQPPLTHVEPHQ